MAKIFNAFGMFDIRKMTLQQVNQTLNLTLNLNVLNQQGELNNSPDNGERTTSGLLEKVKGLAIEHAFEAIKKGIDLTIVGAAKLERQLIDVGNMFGDKNIGKAFFDQINDHALNSQYGAEEFSNITREFVPFTKNTDKLMELNKLSERLAILNPTQGLKGAGNAIKEMINGNGMSLENAFKFDPNEIKALKEATSMDDFVNKFDNVLNKKGGTQLAIEEIGQSATVLWDNLGANISTAFAKAGGNALETLKPILGMINEGFKEGTFQQFFDFINIGLSIISDLIMMIIDVVTYAVQVIQENWSIIEPILIGIALYFVGTLIPILWNVLIPVLWDTITTILAMGISWAMVNWPILLIIGLIALFIYVLTQCGVTAEQVLGFIGGIFGLTFAFIHNHIAYLWNKFASFAEFIANLFIDPVYAIKKLFYDMATNILGRIANIAKAVTDLINMIPGVKVNLHSGIDNLISKIPIPKSDKNVVKIPRMKQLDYENEFKYGYGKGAGIAKGIGSIFSVSDLGNISKKANLDAWNKKQGSGKLNNILDNNKNLLNPADNRYSNAGGKNLSNANKHLESIDDKIDISNEHLEMLRDLAEQESIQNFVTLTPTVQVTTGDIKEEADINKIIDKIESYMENELVNSAEGVYA